MKHALALLVFFTIHATLLAQSSKQQEINAQVWVPFIETFNRDDTKALSEVHSKDFIRVIRDSDLIFGYSDAFRERPDSVKARMAVWQRKIELRFIQRIASDEEAFEVGYYKTSYNNEKTDEQRTSYGKFHVLLRREEGIWKILMDADGGLGVDEAVFQTGKEMDVF